MPYVRGDLHSWTSLSVHVINPDLPARQVFKLHAPTTDRYKLRVIEYLLINPIRKVGPV